MVYRDGQVRGDTLGHYGPDVYVRGLIDFMKSHRDKPFLAYYSMALCHEVTDDLETPVPHGPIRSIRQLSRNGVGDGPRGGASCCSFGGVGIA